MPIGVSLKNRRTGLLGESVVLPFGTTAERTENPLFGNIRFNLDIGKIEFYNGTTWVNLSVEGVSNVIVDSFVGNGAQNAFTLSQTITEETDILVFVGNVWQAPVDNYIITTPDQLILPTAPLIDVTVHVIHNLASNVV